MKTNAWKRRERGYTLIEVLVGILIFALGMLALSQLQGTLARNTTDSTARTVAVNVAEEVIEQARMFGQITSDGVNRAYQDIQSTGEGGYTLWRGGKDCDPETGDNCIAYQVDVNVADYWYNRATQTFSTTEPVGAARSDMKLMEVTVTWNDSQEFFVDGATQTIGRMGSGSITLRDVISSITAPSGGKVALGTTAVDAYAPPVDYNPGENPDIVSIQLGANKFKESTTPLPDVIRADELVETRFDVVTYSQSEAGATFLRREEFRALSCECTLRIPSGTDEGGLRPTIWNGNDYTQGEFVSKPYGESANNQQSAFCDICCRDHHDGGTGTEDDVNDPGKSQYDPFLPATGYYEAEYGALLGDHKHYRRDSRGNLVLATVDGQTYLEACRLVRKDGFWRVAQDLRQEGLNSFPADFLDSDAEVEIYSDYVTDAVLAYETAIGRNAQYEGSPPALTPPANMVPAVVFPASTYGNATEMQSGVLTRQQLRSRGVYLDYMSDELRDRINCLQDNYSPESCGVPSVTTALEIIPFYDVQLTWLSRWTETPNNNPIDVSNEAIADNNAHSRGVATLEAGFGYSTVNAEVHSGNLGLTGTDPIDPWYAWDLEDYNLYALAVDYNNPPPLSSYIVAGSITSAVGGVKAADVEIEFTDAQCDRTNTGYECVIEADANTPRLTVSNYFKQGKILVACAVNYLTLHGTEHSGEIPDQNWTRFNLPKNVTTSVANIVIMENSCSS